MKHERKSVARDRSKSVRDAPLIREFVNRLSPRVGVTSGEENAEMFDEEILTWMIVQVPREDREAIARLYGGRTHALCLVV